MRTLCWPLLATGVIALTSQAEGQGSARDSIRASAFDRLDRTSRMLLATVNCASMSAQARADGLFGPPDSLGRRGQCLRKNDQTFGVFFTPDTAFTVARQLVVLDLAKRARYSGPVDTTAILAEARAADEAVNKGFPAFLRERRQFAPFSMRSDGDSIEVWLVPIGVLAGRTPTAVGGELGFIYSPDGRKLVREIDAFDKYRLVQLADSGRVQIVSREDDLPLVSELIATNRLNDRGREVLLLTNTYASQLIGRGAAATWLQIRRP
ncbi:MAG: hypothetical protein ACJ77S_06855 [Gemmatimonadaceae bacterium]